MLACHVSFKMFLCFLFVLFNEKSFYTKHQHFIYSGFYLTGVVIDSKLKKEEQNVAVTFDRCQVVTCSCSCPASSKWCCHVIALCLHRIRCPDQVSFRAPISESLSMLKRDQLQKFTQYLINELPPKVLLFKHFSICK